MRVEVGRREVWMILGADDAAVAAPDGRLLFKTGKQFICKEDRIVLLGPNGAGKTRFVAMLRQAIETPEAAQAGIHVGIFVEIRGAGGAGARGRGHPSRRRRREDVLCGHLISSFY